MKTLHIHIKTENLDQSVAYYAALFGAEPTKREPDYAQWRLDDPRANVSISTRSGASGVDHAGVSFDNDEELEAAAVRLRDIESLPAPEKNTTCCYAKSNKYWSHDPQGVIWELFHTFGDSETYGAAFENKADLKQACCAPQQGQ